MKQSQTSTAATPVVVPPAPHRAGRHRLPAPPSALRGRAAVIAVAAGATVSAASAGTSFTQAAHTDTGNITLLAGAEPVTGDDVAETPAPAPSPSAPTPVATAPEPAGQDAESTWVSTLAAGTEINAQREIAEEEARRPAVALPAVGAFTSGFGPRWGTFHGGIDIANAVGTPIHAATDGVVIEAGPAQGYGNWVKVMSDDGVMTLYGHMSSVLVSTGQRVVAGQQIALMGSEGFSTGSHLHFEVWTDNGETQVDPRVWLLEHGIDVAGGTVSDPIGSAVSVAQSFITAS